jgi:hypothetical protein
MMERRVENAEREAKLGAQPMDKEKFDKDKKKRKKDGGSSSSTPFF